MRHRVVIVSDDQDWADRAARAGAEAPLSQLRRWAAELWYPLSIVSLRSALGAWEIESALEAIGYERFVHTVERWAREC